MGYTRDRHLGRPPLLWWQMAMFIAGYFLFWMAVGAGGVLLLGNILVALV